MNGLAKIAFAHAIREALMGERFDICSLRRAYALCDIDGEKFQRGKLYPTLHALHCAKWANLPEGTAREVLTAVLKELNVVQQFDAAKLLTVEAASVRP